MDVFYPSDPSVNIIAYYSISSDAAVSFSILFRRGNMNRKRSPSVQKGHEYPPSLYKRVPRRGPARRPTPMPISRMPISLYLSSGKQVVIMEKQTVVLHPAPNPPIDCATTPSAVNQNTLTILLSRPKMSSWRSIRVRPILNAPFLPIFCRRLPIVSDAMI